MPQLRPQVDSKALGRLLDEKCSLIQMARRVLTRADNAERELTPFESRRMKLIETKIEECGKRIRQLEKGR